jgi:hypothetical protein
MQQCYYSTYLFVLFVGDGNWYEAKEYSIISEVYSNHQDFGRATPTHPGGINA